MNDVNAPVKRNVGFLLGLGILFFPILFVWFLLRKGHSVLSRLIGFGWLVLSIVIVVSGPPSSTSSSNRGSSSSVSSAAEEPTDVYTATQVSTSYDENTVAADALFKGKKVRVNGRITDINTDFRGNPYLVLAGANKFLGPQFKFDKSNISALAALKKGAVVTVMCIGAGDVIKTPMFEDCEMSY